MKISFWFYQIILFINPRKDYLVMEPMAYLSQGRRPQLLSRSLLWRKRRGELPNLTMFG